jgi:hypothetical protein
VKRLGAALLALALAGCAVEHEIALELDTSSPLECVDRATASVLVARAFQPAHREEDVLLVFDMVRTPSFPRCRPSTVLDECTVTGCDAIPEARSCIRVPRASFEGLDITSTDQLIVSDFVAGQPRILDDAPDGTIVVRVTIVLDGAAEDPCPTEEQPLAALPAFDPARLLGCAYSCPVVLIEESIVEIDLDPIMGGRICDESHVQACASFGL